MREACEARGIRAAGDWLTPFERFWRGPLAALDTELARGRRSRAADARRAHDQRAGDTAPGKGEE